MNVDQRRTVVKEGMDVSREGKRRRRKGFLAKGVYG